MRIIDIPDRLAERILNTIDEFESIPSELRRINKKLDRIEGHEQQEAIDLAALTARVEAGTALDESIKTLVEGIADELADDPNPAIQALAARLREQTAALTAAVQANT